MFFHTLFSLKIFLPRGSNTKQSHLNIFIFYLHDSHIEKCFTNRNIFPLVWNQTTVYCQLFFYMCDPSGKINSPERNVFHQIKHKFFSFTLQNVYVVVHTWHKSNFDNK